MSLSIGLSALQSSQVGLDVLSQNIANASTPGYHRQNVHFASVSGNSLRGISLGAGVTVNNVERVRLTVLESFLTETTSDFHNADQSATLQRQIETFFLPGEGSIHNSLQTLFNDISTLAGAPSDFTARSLSVQSADQLAGQFRDISENLRIVQDSLLGQINAEIGTLNSELQELDNLNQDIVTASNSGRVAPNGLLDSRDVLINSIAEKIDISRLEADDASLSLTFGNLSIQRRNTDVEFELRQINGELSLQIDDEDFELQLNSGRISALIDVYNNVIPDYQGQLDQLAQGLIANFDRVHSTGIGNDGSFSNLVGNRAVTNANFTLEHSGAGFPIRTGDLHISIIDPDGNRRTETISIDPATQSLRDVVDNLDAIDNLNASVNPQTNRVQINASAGHQFDFTGITETVPNLTSFTGTSLPALDGKFNGENNQQLSFEIAGSGNVGVDEDLTLLVFDSAGNQQASYNIGNGYEAGTPIEIGDGVTITFPPGTVQAGDTFDAQLVSEPDETGFLVALGINSFFSGFDATTIQVDQEILDDPGRFATSITGDTAESFKINQFIEVADARVLDSNRLTLEEFLVDFTTEIGVNVRTSERLTSNLDTLLAQYQQERDSLSGVDVNEEFVLLQQQQRTYEAAVRVISTAQDVLDELFSLTR